MLGRNVTNQKGMIDYLDVCQGSGIKPEPPKPQTWAERAFKSYSDRREAERRAQIVPLEVELLHSVRNSINTYTVHARTYTRKISRVPLFVSPIE